MNQDEILNRLKSLSSPKRFLTALGNFLGRLARFLAFFFAFLTVAYCVYLWYGTIYHSEWSSDQRKAYISSKEQGISFNTKIFDYDVKAIELRKEERQKNLDNLADIFRLKNPVDQVAENQPAEQANIQ